MNPPIESVLITGAGGFIGNHLCRYLTSNGYKGRIIAYDDFSIGNRKGLDQLDGSRVDVVTGDILNVDDLADYVRRADAVIHLAAISDPRACDANPELARRTNVDGTAAVLAASRGKRVVFLSSAMVYGTQGEEPFTEESKLAGEGVYCETKLEGERLCREANEQGLLDAVIVRNFNSYGGGQSEAFLIPKLVRQALFEGRIEMWNCAPVRDFTYVEDTARALMALAQSEEAEGVFNLGSGIPTRVGDLACEVSRLLQAPVSCLNKPVTGSRYLVASNDRIRRVVGWEPKVDLQDGLARTIESFQMAADPESLRSSLSLPGQPAGSRSTAIP